MRVIKNYLYNAGYNILALILPLITGPYIGRVLKPEGVGINSYTNSLIQWFVLIAGIGISYYGNREIAYVREDKKKMTQTFWEIQILKVIMTVVAFFLFALFIQFYRKYYWYMILQSLNIVAAAIDISWLYMGIEDFKRTVIRNTMVKLASLAMIFMFVRDTSDVGVYIVILALSLIGGNLTLWPHLRVLLTKISIKELQPLRHFVPTVSLFVPQIATQIYLILNKNMLGIFAGATSAGFYNQSDALVKVVLGLVTATGTVMLPHVSNAFAKGETKKVNELLYNSFDFVSCLAIVMMFGLAAVSKYLGTMFYGPGFGSVGLALMIESIVIVLIGWSNVVGTQYLLPTNKVRSFTISVVFGAIVNIILNFPFIYLWGLYGAVWATVLSELAVTAYQLWVVRYSVDLKKMFENFIKYLIAGIVMFVPVYYLELLWKPKDMNLQGIMYTGLEVIIGIAIYAIVLLILKPTILDKIKLIRNKKRG